MQSAETVSSKNPNLLTMMAMGDGATSRVRRAMTAYAAASAAYALGRTAWTRGISEITFTVTVESGDEIYGDVHAWVLERVPARHQRSLVARSRRIEVSPRQFGPEQNLSLFYDGRRTQNLRVGAHRFRVMVEQQDVGNGKEDQGGWGSWRRDRVVFTAFGLPARDAILGVLRGMSEKRNARHEVRLFGPSWDSWSRIAEMPLRALDSVVLAEGQREDLVEDMGRFLAAEEMYNRLGLPWHRGYLLAGPPGTGKTSMAKVLAQHFHLDVYFLPLTAVANDGALSRMLSQVPPRSLLLLEDIDIVHGARKRDDSEPGVTLSGLLNGLDGVLTPHGLITVLTTNNADVLDDALIRPGRVDRTFHLGYLDDPTQLARLVAYAMRGAMGSSALPDLVGLRVSPADVVETLKPHLEDPAAALDALHELASHHRRLPATGRPLLAR